MSERAGRSLREVSARGPTSHPSQPHSHLRFRRSCQSLPLCKSPLAAKAVRAECGRSESVFPENLPKSGPHGIVFRAVPHYVDIRRKRRHFDRYKRAAQRCS